MSLPKIKDIAMLNTPEKLFSDAYGRDINPVLCDIIFNHFRSYRITLEDPMDWALEVWTGILVTAAPAADKLFQSVNQIEDPTLTVRMSTTVTNESNADSVTGSSSYDNGVNGSENRNLDTPQGRISNLDDGFLTAAARSHGVNNGSSFSGNSSSSASDSTTENVTEGFSGDQAQILMNYRKTLYPVIDEIYNMFAPAFVLWLDEDGDCE